MHGVIVARGGRFALERYFESEDETWGKTLGRVRFGPTRCMTCVRSRRASWRSSTA